MFAMIEVNRNAVTEVSDVLGWQVSVSQRVWDRCVVPKVAEGQAEWGRLHDFLAQLRFNLGLMAAPRQERISAGFGFSVNVANDNHDRRRQTDGLEGPGEAVPLAVFASFREDGGPLLVVLTRVEASPLEMDYWD